MSAASQPQAARRPRVLIADDSALMRRVLQRTLEDDGIEVVGTAADGDEALAQCAALRPDAMTLDLHMPGTDGLAVLRALRQPGAPKVPAVVVSAFSPAHGARAVDALAEGAFELVAKPGAGTTLDEFSQELRAKLRAAAAAGVASPPAARRATPSTLGRIGTAVPPTSALGRATPAPIQDRPTRPSLAARPAAAPAPRAGVRPSAGARLVVIACSTGGPRALAELLPELPSPLGAGVLIVQHMPPGFTESLAARLDRASPLNVREAGTAESIAPGVALLAPGGSHLRLAGERRTTLSDEAPVGNLRPRADLTIVDAARLWGSKLLLVVLTGMGKDGLEGAEEVRRQGGRVLAEAEESCTVYGMPRAVVEAGLADVVLPLSELPAAIIQEAGR